MLPSHSSYGYVVFHLPVQPLIGAACVEVPPHKPDSLEKGIPKRGRREGFNNNREGAREQVVETCIIDPSARIDGRSSLSIIYVLTTLRFNQYTGIKRPVYHYSRHLIIRDWLQGFEKVLGTGSNG